jgi:hypothetical protein
MKLTRIKLPLILSSTYSCFSLFKKVKYISFDSLAFIALWKLGLSKIKMVIIIVKNELNYQLNLPFDKLPYNVNCDT